MIGYLFLAAALVVLPRLIQEARRRYRFPSRPTTRRLKDCLSPVAVSLIGNLGADPAVRHSQKGTPIASFRVAVNQVRTGPDGDRQESAARRSGRGGDRGDLATKRRPPRVPIPRRRPVVRWSHPRRAQCSG